MVKRRFFAMAVFLALLSLTILAPAPGMAGLEEGKQAYLQGDFVRAFQEFMPLAEAGDPMVQNQIAAMYYRGQGVPQDYAKAAEWFARAADHGSVDAQYLLGKLYLSGQGVPQDLELAAKWITEAALGGKSPARLLAAQIYLDGRGVQKNEMKAYFWAVMARQNATEVQRTQADALCARIEGTLTPRQIESVKEMAANWIKNKR